MWKLFAGSAGAIGLAIAAGGCAAACRDPPREKAERAVAEPAASPDEQQQPIDRANKVYSLGNQPAKRHRKTADQKPPGRWRLVIMRRSGAGASWRIVAKAATQSRGTVTVQAVPAVPVPAVPALPVWLSHSMKSSS